MLRRVALTRNALLAALLRWAGGLRFRSLSAITAALFLIDLALPDPIPFADEVLLGLGALMLASLRRRDEEEEPDDAADG